MTSFVVWLISFLILISFDEHIRLWGKEVIVFENLRLRLSTRKQKAVVFENLHSGERF